VFPSEITPEVATVLPRSLTTLSGHEVWFSAIHLLPTGLKRLKIRRHGLSETVNEEKLETLKYLPLDSISTRQLRYDLSKYFPSCLKELTIDDGPMEARAIESLPRHMRVIILMREQPFENDESWKYLPRHIYNLDVLPVSREVEAIPISSPLSSSWLPRNLLTLTIGPLDVNDASWFSGLPTMITILKLHLVTIQHDALRHLNTPRLKTFVLNINTSPPEGLGETVRTIPRSLKSFSIWLRDTGPTGSGVENRDLSNLPHSLTSLSLPSSSLITQDVEPYLPPRLQSFQFGTKGSPFWFNKR